MIDTTILDKPELIQGNLLMQKFMKGNHKGYSTQSNTVTLYYHSSWDWLMPVWHHFRQTCWNTIGYTEFNTFWERFKNSVFNNDIKKANEVLVEGIKWYNEQQHGKQKA